MTEARMDRNSRGASGMATAGQAAMAWICHMTGICELGLLLQFSHWRGLGKTSRVHFSLNKIICPIQYIRKWVKVTNSSEIFRIRKYNKQPVLLLIFAEEIGRKKGKWN